MHIDIQDPNAKAAIQAELIKQAQYYHRVITEYNATLIEIVKALDPQVKLHEITNTATNELIGKAHGIRIVLKTVEQIVTRATNNAVNKDA